MVGRHSLGIGHRRLKWMWVMWRMESRKMCRTHIIYTQSQSKMPISASTLLESHSVSPFNRHGFFLLRLCFLCQSFERLLSRNASHETSNTTVEWVLPLIRMKRSSHNYLHTADTLWWDNFGSWIRNRQHFPNQVNPSERTTCHEL